MASEVEKLGKQVAGLQEKLDNLLANGIGLGRSSFSNGYINQYTSGSLGSTFGTQFDGTNGVYAVNGPPPPIPRWTTEFGPVSAEAIVGGLRIRWEGFFEPDDTVHAPMDFKNIEVYVTDQTSTPSVLFTYMKTTINSARGGEVLLSLPAETSGFYVWLVTRTLAGQVSGFSQVLGPFTPLKIRESDLGFDINEIAGTTIWYGADDPALDSNNAVHIGDLWLKDVTTDESTPQYLSYRRMPDDTWGLLADQGATAALASAVAAQQTADAKAKPFVQDTEPTWSGPAGSAIWLDSSNGNLIHVWDGTSFVLQQLGNGAIQPASLVASEVVVTGTVTAALLEAILVLATTIIAGTPTGTHVEIREDGVYVYSNDPVDGVPNEVVRMGTDTNDYFGITDVNGLLQLSLDVTGAVNARTGNFREDITIQGRGLSAMLNDIPGGGEPGSGAKNQFGWVDGSIGGVTTEIGIAERSFILSSDRNYEIGWEVSYRRSQESTAALFRIRDGGSGTPSVSSPLVMLRQDASQPADYSGTCLKTSPWKPGFDGEHRFILTAQAALGGYIDVLNDVFPTLICRDLGPAEPWTASVNRGGGSTPPPAQNYYTELVYDNRTTYRGNGSIRTDTTDVVQGWDPSGNNGDGYGWFGFGNLPNITGTITRVDLYLYFNLWYYNSGGSPIINLLQAGDASTLAGFNALKLKSNFVGSGWPKPGGVWFTLPSDWWPLFKITATPHAYAVSLGQAGSTDETYYGRASDCRLRLWWTQ